MCLQTFYLIICQRIVNNVSYISCICFTDVLLSAQNIVLINSFTTLPYFSLGFYFYSLPNNKFEDMPKFKAFVDDIMNVTEKKS